MSVVFYQKTGCKTNRKQRKILESLGVEFEVVDLIKHPWTEQELEAFFKEADVTAWFNMRAPQITSGEINPDGYNKAEALKLMKSEPILIKRPLIETPTQKICGFDIDSLCNELGITRVTDMNQASLEECSNKDVGECKGEQDVSI